MFRKHCVFFMVYSPSQIIGQHKVLLDIIGNVSGHVFDDLEHSFHIIELPSARLQSDARPLGHLVQVFAIPRRQLLAQQLTCHIIVQTVVSGHNKEHYIRSMPPPPRPAVLRLTSRSTATDSVAPAGTMAAPTISTAETTNAPATNTSGNDRGHRRRSAPAEHPSIERRSSVWAEWLLRWLRPQSAFELDNIFYKKY